jgi:hypothetical protein
LLVAYASLPCADKRTKTKRTTFSDRPRNLLVGFCLSFPTILRGHGIGPCREAFKGSDRAYAAQGVCGGDELETAVHVFGTLYLDTAYSENSRLLTEAAR